MAESPGNSNGAGPKCYAHTHEAISAYEARSEKNTPFPYLAFRLGVRLPRLQDLPKHSADEDGRHGGDGKIDAYGERQRRYSKNLRRYSSRPEVVMIPYEQYQKFIQVDEAEILVRFERFQRRMEEVNREYSDEEKFAVTLLMTWS